jgi:hypothetical protein
MKKSVWKIRAEIIGEFVSTYEFDNKAEADAKFSQLVCDGVYDDIDIWEVQ